MQMLLNRALLVLALWLVLWHSGTAAAQTTSGNPTTGGTLYNTTFNCALCHAVDTGGRHNAINAGGVITYANTQGMGGTAGTAQQYADIAAYIATFYPAQGTQNVAFETPAVITIPDLSLNTPRSDFVGIRQVSAPARGSAAFTLGSLDVTYTPAGGQCGLDSLTYEAYQQAPGTVRSNTRTLSLSIANPAAPNISTSAGTITATTNVAMAAYAPVNSGGTPLSYALTGTLPTGLGFSTTTGQITGTPTQSGTFSVTINARNCLNGNLAGQSGSKAVTITSKLAQSITFGTLANKLATDPPFTISATASSGLTIAFTSATTAVCTVLGNTVTLITTGTCTINADQAGDATRYPAPTVSQGFIVGGTQTINFPAPAATALLGNPPVAVNVTATSGLPVALTSSDTAICTVTGASSPYSVTLLAVGVCSLTASQPGNASFAPATPVFRVFAIAPASVRIATGASPRAVAVNPVTNKIYIANSTSNNVTVMDGSTGSTSTVATGATPYSVAVNPVTNKIYVTNYAGNSVTVIDGATQAATSVTVGQGPIALALNPATNRVYVANYSAGNVTVIDGATLATTNVSTGTTPVAIAVNPVTNKVYVANAGGTMTVIDGANNATSNVTLGGSNPSAISINPATNRIYLVLQGSNTVAVVNGATLAVTNVPVNNVPLAIAANPATNRIYVANQLSGNVSVIDGGTSTVTATLTVDGFPTVVALNAVTNQIYVAGTGSPTLSVIDGVTNAVTSRAAGLAPIAIGVNPLTNRIYVANNGGNDVTVADGSTNLQLTLAGNFNQQVAINPVTLRAYIPGRLSNLLHVYDGATRSFSTVTLSAEPSSVVVNPANGRVYVNHATGFITVIDGGSGSVITTIPGCSARIANTNTNQILALCGTNTAFLDGATHAATVIPGLASMTSNFSTVFNPVTNRFHLLGRVGSAVTLRDLDATNLSVVDTTIALTTTTPGLALNSVSNRLYLADADTASVIVVDGATRAITSVGLPPGTGGGRVVVNESTNRVYVSAANNGFVTILDGASNGVIGQVPAGDTPVEMVLDQATNRVYAGNYSSLDLSVVDGAINAAPATNIALGIVPVGLAASSRTGEVVVVRASKITVIKTRNENVLPLEVSIQALLGNITSSTSPVFPISVFTTNPSLTAVYYQLDSRSGPWLKATGSAADFTVSLAGLSRGLHTLYVFATDGQEATSVNGGAQSSPQMSRVESYAFTVVPPAANLSGVFSRKVHGTPGTAFDLPIATGVPAGGAVDVEPRAGASGHTLVFRFDAPLYSSGSATLVDANAAPIGSVGPLSVTGLNGDEISVPLLGVPDAKRVTVTLSGVLGAPGSFAASLGFLIGDVGNTRAVTAADLSAIKARTGAANSGNFRFDLNTNGTVGAEDIAIAKSRSATVMPNP